VEKMFTSMKNRSRVQLVTALKIQMTHSRELNQTEKEHIRKILESP